MNDFSGFFINPNIYPALISGIILFFAGVILSRNLRDNKIVFPLFFVLLLLCLPGLSFILYYMRIFGEPIRYVEFRCIRGVEILSCLWGLFFGFIYSKVMSSSGSSLFRNILEILFAFISMILILIPFIKPIILPVQPSVQFQDRWRDGVCLQSGGSTCGPASLATVLSIYGVRKSEEEIARNSYSCSSGTENWYMIRYARSLGFKVSCSKENDIDKVPFPSIIGTRLGKIGHFVVLLDRVGESYIIGDSLKGRLKLSREEFDRRYRFEGVVVYLEK